VTSNYKTRYYEKQKHLSMACSCDALGVALLNYMDRQMLSTMKSAMQVDIIELQSATNFGRLMAVFLWIYGLMSPISGIIADRMTENG
jgi:sugar phosphate permease